MEDKLTCRDCMYFCMALNPEDDTCGLDAHELCGRDCPACCCFEDCGY